MTVELSAQLDQFLGHEGDLTPVPCLVKGVLVYPDIESEAMPADLQPTPAQEDGHVSATANTWVIRNMGADNDRPVYQALARIEPARLLEQDAPTLTRELYSLPMQEVFDYVGALRDLLRSNKRLLEQAADAGKASGVLDNQLLDFFYESLPALLDPTGLAEAVDRELGADGIAGRRYLDEWITPEVDAHRGVMARIASRFERTGSARPEHRPSVRAMPTRQLHITAGNAPVVPFISFIRALATKSAAVIKSPAEMTTLSALLGMAMVALDRNHPITRHTSLVYWKGGDRTTEDVLFSANAFDRVVVWGSPETVNSVAGRVVGTKTVFLNPRYGLSLIGHEGLGDTVEDVARRASIDTMIANQRACTASLVHYVVGNESEALRYCEQLQHALARWDDALPQTVPRAVLGQVRMLRRAELRRASWFVNGTSRDVRSAVVYSPEPFDIAAHPMARLVVVRPLQQAEQIVEYLNPGVSTIGVYPDALHASLRDVIAATGVSNIFPLGEAERVYAGIPHDGMRVLSELVNWTNS